MLRTGLLALCMLFTLAACGQKGDLYLPAAKTTQPEQPQQATSRHHG